MKAGWQTKNLCEVCRFIDYRGDECHRGGANDESNWHGILDYFAPAVQLGLTATPKRKDNVDTYVHFGEPMHCLLTQRWHERRLPHALPK